jgi:hypothetical protein
MHAIAKRLGLSDWGTGGKKIERQSKVHPTEDLFKIGYFRSSYNSAGINSVLDATIHMDLYSVFKPNDRYIFRPAWNACLKRANVLRATFKKYIEGLDTKSASDLEWYVQALDIVVETIEYVLAKPDKEKYYFHWSS